MSQMGQKETFAGSERKSALPPKADINLPQRHVCFGPTAEIPPRVTRTAHGYVIVET